MAVPKAVPKFTRHALIEFKRLACSGGTYCKACSLGWSCDHATGCCQQLSPHKDGVWCRTEEVEDGLDDALLMYIELLGEVPQHGSHIVQCAHLQP